MNENSQRFGRFGRQAVLVPGAARGTGESHVRGFLAEGACVVVTDGSVLAGVALRIEKTVALTRQPPRLREEAAP